MSQSVGVLTGRALLAYHPDTEAASEWLKEHIFNVNMSDSQTVRERGEGGTALMKLMPDIAVEGKRETSR